jgi:protein SCO1/2
MAAVAWADGVSLFQKPWRWQDEQGTDIAFSKWRGTPLIVAMGYSSCSSRCPIVLDKLQRVEKAYLSHNLKAEFVMVTLDPGNDTKEVLASYKRLRGITRENWHFLRGSESTTEELIRFLHLLVTNDNSHIDHETKIFVFDREGKLVRTLRGWNFQEETAVIPESSR